MPPNQRLLQCGQMPARHVGKGGRTRPTVEIFVAAAHREVHLQRVQFDWHGTRGMRQIPEDLRTVRLGMTLLAAPESIVMPLHSLSR